jgi:hypothetical protein
MVDVPAERSRRRAVRSEPHVRRIEQGCWSTSGKTISSTIRTISSSPTDPAEVTN